MGKSERLVLSGLPFDYFSITVPMTTPAPGQPTAMKRLKLRLTGDGDAEPIYVNLNMELTHSVRTSFAEFRLPGCACRGRNRRSV